MYIIKVILLKIKYCSNRDAANEAVSGEGKLERLIVYNI